MYIKCVTISQQGPILTSQKSPGTVSYKTTSLTHINTHTHTNIFIMYFSVRIATLCQPKKTDAAVHSTKKEINTMCRDLLLSLSQIQIINKLCRVQSMLSTKGSLPKHPELLSLNLYMSGKPKHSHTNLHDRKATPVK